MCLLGDRDQAKKYEDMQEGKRGNVREKGFGINKRGGNPTEGNVRTLDYQHKQQKAASCKVGEGQSRPRSPSADPQNPLSIAGAS